MKKITDLTLPIEENWNWNVNMRLVCSHEAGDPWQITGYDLLSHEFTHIDSPKHHTPDGVDLDAYPLQDWAITDCLILDVSYVGDNEEITAAMLEKANEPFKDKHYDTLIIRSDRPRKVSWKTREFWDNSCWVSIDGALWIKDYNPKIVGYDFAQDYMIRKVPELKPKENISQPVHDIVLKEGKILQVEFLTNLWEVPSPTCTFICLPIKLNHADGGQVRAIAVTEE